MGGALVFHWYLTYKSDKFFDEQISKNRYSLDDLTEVKIPANLPAITDWKNYENMEGSVHFSNTSYNYVKIKMTRTAIYLMCIPNYSTTQLQSKNIIDARHIADIPVPKKDHVPFGKVDFTTYSYQSTQYNFTNMAIAISKAATGNHFMIPVSHITGPGQPPETACLLS